MIKNGLRDLKEQITDLGEEEEISKNHMKQQIFLKIFLSLIDNNKGKAQKYQTKYLVDYQFLQHN